MTEAWSTRSALLTQADRARATMPSTLDTPADSLPTPNSPSQKTVSFDESPSSSSSALPSETNAPRPTAKRRRSSLKQGSAMPYRPPKETYSHPDPLIRRLRLRDGYGNEVDLVKEFREAKVVLFFFGCVHSAPLVRETALTGRRQQRDMAGFCSRTVRPRIDIRTAASAPVQGCLRIRRLGRSVVRREYAAAAVVGDGVSRDAGFL